MNATTYALFFVLIGAAGIDAAAPAPRVGKVLLLENEQIVEGNIERTDEGYCIKGQTGETTLPAERALALVQTRKEAYEVLRQYANLRDPDERLRLARWCVLHGLRDEAIQEAQAVLSIDSKNAEAELILLQIRETKPAAEARAVASPPKGTNSEPIVEVTAANFNRESFGLFVTKVQPILMNTCIGCHSTGKGGSFQLIRTTFPGGRRANLQNLAIALKFLDRKQPGRSVLLQKSVTAHGNADSPPLKDQKILAYENLQAWVSLALAPDGATEGIPLESEEKPPMTKWEPAKPVDAPKKNGPVFGQDSTSKPLPEMKSAPSDPFDPAIFNGEIKPKN